MLTWYLPFTTPEEAKGISEPPSKGSEEALGRCVAQGHAPASEVKARISLTLDIPLEGSPLKSLLPTHLHAPRRPLALCVCA